MLWDSNGGGWLYIMLLLSLQEKKYGESKVSQKTENALYDIKHGYENHAFRQKITSSCTLYVFIPLLTEIFWLPVHIFHLNKTVDLIHSST